MRSVYVLSLHKNITEKLQFFSLEDSRSNCTLFSKYPWCLLRFAEQSSHFANLIIISDLFYLLLSHTECLESLHFLYNIITWWMVCYLNIQDIGILKRGFLNVILWWFYFHLSYFLQSFANKMENLWSIIGMHTNTALNNPMLDNRLIYNYSHFNLHHCKKCSYS